MTGVENVLKILGIINGLGIVFLMLYLVRFTKKFDYSCDPLSKFGTFKETSKIFNSALLIYGLGQFIFVLVIFSHFGLLDNPGLIALLVGSSFSTAAVGLCNMDKNYFLHVLVTSSGIILATILGMILTFKLLEQRTLLGALGLIVSALMILWIIHFPTKKIIKQTAVNELILLALVLCWNLVFTAAII